MDPAAAAARRAAQPDARPPAVARRRCTRSRSPSVAAACGARRCASCSARCGQFASSRRADGGTSASTQTVYTWIEVGTLQGRARVPPRHAVGGDDPDRHVRRHADPHLLDGYMAHDPRYAAYFGYLNLFTASMLILVLGANLPVMFIGWEGVGLCSFLLIGFWYENDDVRRRRAARRSSSTASATSASCSACSCCSGRPRTRRREHRARQPRLREPARTRRSAGVYVQPLLGRRAARRRGRHLPVHRRVRQERADPAVRLAARRDGRPDAGLRADPRRDDGDRRRLHGRAGCRSCTRRRRPR